jgi:hypothetical protein
LNRRRFLKYAGQGQRTLNELQKPLTMDEKIDTETVHQDLTNAQKRQFSRRDALIMLGGFLFAGAAGPATYYLKSHLGENGNQTSYSTQASYSTAVTETRIPTQTSQPKVTQLASRQSCVVALNRRKGKCTCDENF